MNAALRTTLITKKQQYNHTKNEEESHQRNEQKNNQKHSMMYQPR
jgi:hypothetical protein